MSYKSRNKNYNKWYGINLGINQKRDFNGKREIKKTIIIITTFKLFCTRVFTRMIE